MPHSNHAGQVFSKILWQAMHCVHLKLGWWQQLSRRLCLDVAQLVERPTVGVHTFIGWSLVRFRSSRCFDPSLMQISLPYFAKQQHGREGLPALAMKLAEQPAFISTSASSRVCTYVQLISWSMQGDALTHNEGGLLPADCVSSFANLNPSVLRLVNTSLTMMTRSVRDAYSMTYLASRGVSSSVQLLVGR